MNEWNIQTRGHACQACGRPFHDKDPYHTVLYSDREGPMRQDICPTCWGESYAEGATQKKGFISYWQGVYEAPPAAAPDPLKKETAEDLLRKLVEAGDPRNAPACFILAVMLERKRVLRTREQFKEEGRRVLVYENAKTGEIFRIVDPDLQLDQLDQLQRDLSLLLEHGLNPPPPAAPLQPVDGGSAAAPTEEEQAPT
jgi:hypothetical protein